MDIETVYRTYFNDVYRYLTRLTGSETLAEDLTADTFFKAMKAIDGFRGDCDVRVWLCRIAKNEYYSHLKKNRRAAAWDDDALSMLPDGAPGAAEQTEQKAQLAVLRAGLHTLPDPYKEVFMWRVFGELAFGEIGRLFGKTENWACVTYHRARKMLIERTEENQNG